MVKKATAVTLLFLAAYSLFVYFFEDKISRTGQNQYDRNIVKGEEYLYEKGQKADVLILGSSLASRLIMDSLPANYYNLAMGGMGIYDGISLLSKSSRKPKVVLIEMNVVLRDLNKDLERDLYHPVFYSVKKYIPILRKKYQPVPVLKALFRDRSGMKPDAGLYQLPKHLFEREVAGVIERYSVPPKPELTKRKFGELNRDVQMIRKSGIQVIFFEMPIHQDARNLIEPQTTRTAFYKYFPKSEFRYIDSPQDIYQTSDGIHLGPEDALRYTIYLRNKIKELI